MDDDLLYRVFVCIWFAAFFALRYRNRQVERALEEGSTATRLAEEADTTTQENVEENAVKASELPQLPVAVTSSTGELSPSTNAVSVAEEDSDQPVKMNQSYAVSSVSAKSSGYFELDPDIHIRIRPGMTKHMALIQRLRELVTQDEPSLANDAYVMSDVGLWRYLVARRLDVEAARKQAVSSLRWRHLRKPMNLRANDVKLEISTGKSAFRGLDRHGRPVVVLDSSVENTWNGKGNLEGLVFTLQRAFRKMKPPVDKYVLVIRLEDTSFFNFSKLPSPSITKETIKILMTVFAERLGHAIVYKPPTIFVVFLNLFRSLMDAHVLSKAVWISGDVSPGSSNDKSLNTLLGPNWRELLGEGQERYNPNWTPGYNSDLEWKKLVEEEEELYSTKSQ